MPTNVFTNPTFIANEFLRRLKNKVAFLKNTTGSEYAKRFTSSPKPGESISVRLPMQVTTRSGETFSAGDYKQRTTSMTVQTTLGVDLEFTNRELMFNFDKFADTVIEDCAIKLGNTLESTALTFAYKGVSDYVGVPGGGAPTALKTYNQARAQLVRNGAPDSGNILLVTPDMVVEAVDAGKGLFHGVSGQMESGLMSPIAGAKKVYESNLLPVHTVDYGLTGATAEVKGGSQTGTSLITDGWSTKPAAGDIFELESTYAVNHETKVSYGTKKKFSVVSSGTLAADESTLTIRPGITTTGAYQNVSAGPADNDNLTMWASDGTIVPIGLYYHPEAFLFCTFDQPEPPGKISKFVRDPDTGIGIRWIDDWDTSANKELRRFDVVYALGYGQTEFACRIAS